MACDCGTPRTFLVPFLQSDQDVCMRNLVSKEYSECKDVQPFVSLLCSHPNFKTLNHTF